MCFNVAEKVTREETTGAEPTQAKAKPKPKPYCPYCDNRDHYLNSCEEFKKLNTDQVLKWLEDGKRCWKCGRNHTEDRCTLKCPCKTCKETHLTVLHESIQETEWKVYTVSLLPTKVYLDQPNRSQKIMLKVVKVLLHNGNRKMETYPVLDDGSERSIVLPQVVQQVNLVCHPETPPLQTVHQSVKQLNGASVSLEISSPLRPSEKHLISHTFTAKGLALAEHTYPVAVLQQKYKHLRDLYPVHAGPPGGPGRFKGQLILSISHLESSNVCALLQPPLPPSFQERGAPLANGHLALQ